MVALGLVGYALDQAFTQTTQAAVRARLENYFYLALAATDVNEDGSITMSSELTDPRLNQPGSGLYLRIQVPGHSWDSPSSISVSLPETVNLSAGESEFSLADQNDGHYTLRQGLLWELHAGHYIPLTVSAWELRDASDREIRHFRRGLWRWLGGAAVLLLLAQLMFIGWAMRPLQRIARDVGDIESGRSRRLQGLYPKELQPLTRNVNRLLRSEDANQKRYRTALDALAHSLKTPLAVIRTAIYQQELANKGNLRSALDEMQNLVGQQLERAATSARRTLAKPVPVAAEVNRLVESLAKVYADKAIRCSVELVPGVVFYGEQRDLLEILGNLLDNAFKYGRSRVSIRAANSTGKDLRPGLELQVDNDGPAITAEQLPGLLQRGVRGDERSDGHGVGLAIVNDLVESYHGSIRVVASKFDGTALLITIPPA